MHKEELSGWILFSASWCGPCKMIKSEIEKLPNEISESIKIISFEENKDLFTELGIRSVPQFILFKEGISLETYKGIPDIPNKINSLKIKELKLPEIYKLVENG